MGARGAAQLDHDALLLKRRLNLFEVDQRVRLPAVLFDEDVLDHSDGVVAFNLDVFNFPKAMALVEDVDCFHVSFSP